MKCIVVVLILLGVATCEQKIDAEKDVLDFLDDIVNENVFESSSGDHDHSGHMMKMWFHGGCNEVILFDFWRISTYGGLILSCIFIFIMGASYEGLKWFRVYLQVVNTEQVIIETPVNDVQNNESSCHKTNTGNVEDPLVTVAQPKHERSRNSAFSLARLTQALLYIVQLILAYWLMLIVMTYNTWLTIAVILGAGFGHWLFAVLQLKTPHGQAADSFATDACH